MAEAAGGAVGPVNVDALVGDALSAMEADGFQDAQTPGKGGSPKGGKAGSAADPYTKMIAEETGEAGEGAQEPAEGDEAAEEGEGLETAEEGEEEAEEPVSTRGSESDPFASKELPADKYVKIKVDGEDVVVSFQEMAKGYTRTQTFHREVNRSKNAAQQAEEVASRAVQWQQAQRDQIARAMGDPDELLTYYLADDAREKVLHAAAMRYAAMYQAERHDPARRLERVRARQEARLSARERALREQEQRSTTERQQAAFVAQRQAELAPAWQAGLKEAGLPKPTPELQDMVKALLTTVTQRTGRPFTPADLKAAVVRAAKLVNAEPATRVQAKPKPAPVVPSKRTQERAQPKSAQGGKAPRRGSVDALLAGLKPRRF